MSALEIEYVPAGMESRYQFAGLHALISELEIEYVPVGMEYSAQVAGLHALISELEIEYVPWAWSTVPRLPASTR